MPSHRHEETLPPPHAVRMLTRATTPPRSEKTWSASLLQPSACEERPSRRRNSASAGASSGSGRALLLDCSRIRGFSRAASCTK